MKANIMHAPTYLVVAIAVLYNLILYSVVDWARSAPHRDTEFIVGSTAHFLGLVLTAISITLLMGRLRPDRRDPSTPSSNTRLSLQSIALAACVLLPLIFRCFGQDSWLNEMGFRSLLFFGTGIQCAFYFYLFFLISPRWRGFWFGLGLSVGILFVKAGQIAWPVSHTPGRPLQNHSSTLFSASTILSIALTAIILATILFVRRSPSFPRLRGEAQPISASRRRTIALLFLAAAVFYVMNGMLSGILFPMVNFQLNGQFVQLHTLLAIVTPTTGWLLDTDFEKWFRRLVSLCSLAFLLTPSLAVLGDSPATYMFVHTLSALSQSVLFICLILCIDRLIEGSRWFCVLICIPYALRLFAVPGKLLFKLFPGDTMGPVIVVSLLLAALFHHLLSHALCKMATGDGDTCQQGATAPIPTTEIQQSGTEGQKDGSTKASLPINALLSQRGLTRREEDVAKLLARGTSSTGIALALHISENTVNTHVKNILRKFDVTTRKAFMAKLLSGDLR